MKTIKHVLTAIFCLGVWTTKSFAAPQEPDSLTLPGNNFSLDGALELFSKSSSPADFEKALNTADNKVNNLDLNEDGLTDYIRIINRSENDIQIFILQAVISETEFQDIAVIEIEKNGSESALIQIVGDEDIYGEETIVEPLDDNATSFYSNLQNNHGPNAAPVYSESEFAGNNLPGDYTIEAGNAIIVNVWAWPSVRFVFAPGYRVWVSPWAWHARPRWWSPWRPLSLAAYRPFHHQYRNHFVIVPVHRVARGRAIYRPLRVTSVTVNKRNSVAVSHYRKTSVTRKSVNVNHNNKHYTATRKTTTVSGPRGTARKTKTTVRRKR